MTPAHLHVAPKASWPRRIAILSDYIRLPYANGATFATQFLYRELTRRGHEVTIIGPHDPDAKPEDLPERHIAVPSLPLRNHPGVRIPLPIENIMREARSWDFDLIVGQTATELMALGMWLRDAKGIPMLAVNTVHLPSVYPVVMPVSLHHNRTAHWAFQKTFLSLAESASVRAYNDVDGLVVLSSGLERYWRDRGVTSPIHVIPRNVEPKIFDAPAQRDPYPAHFRRGSRLLVVCRHTREKNVERLLHIFARYVTAAVPDASLTLVGDGPDHDVFRRLAAELGVEDRTWFPGEYPVTSLPDFYRNADLFTYTSLSETYGQVVSEALWSGLPAVAFADEMGVSQQVEHEVSGLLVDPGPDEEMADWRFARAVVALLRNPRRRHGLAAAAALRARDRSAPERMIERFLSAFESAGEQRRRSAPARGVDDLRLTARHVSHWMGIHTLLLGLGLLRPPAVVNRHGRKQPAWGDTLPRDAHGANSLDLSSRGA